MMSVQEAVAIKLAERTCGHCERRLGGHKDVVEVTGKGDGFYTARITCPHCRQLIGTALITIVEERSEE